MEDHSVGCDFLDGLECNCEIENPILPVSKLYLVKRINQETGEDMITYYLAHGLEHLEDEIADIVQIQPLTNFEDLTTSE